MRRIVMLLLVAAAGLGCGGVDPPAGFLGELVGRTFGLPHSELPGIYSACGRVQPGYDPGDPGDPEEDPPRDAVPPSVDGVPYNELTDPFCSITFTRRYSQDEDDGTVYMDEDIYVIELGEPDEESPEWDPDYLFEGGRFCTWRWTVEANVGASLADPYSQEDVQLITWTLDAVSERCDNDFYNPGTTTVAEYAIRSTRSEIGLFLPDFFAGWQGYLDEEGTPVPDIRFQGYAGIEEGGGAMVLPPEDLEHGVMTYYEECEPEPAAGGGPGYCRPLSCRLFSESPTMPACTWDDVAALPANPELVLPEWRAAYPELYAAAYGSR